VPLSDQLRFHHVGVACRDLEREAIALAALGYHAECDDFRDLRQGIEGRFVIGPGPRLELLTETEGSHVLEPWLTKGVKLYHQGYEVSDLDLQVEQLISAGAIVVSPRSRQLRSAVAGSASSCSRLFC